MSELDRRGMTETRQQWDSLADQRAGRPDRTRIPREPVAVAAGDQVVRLGQTSVETTVQTTEQTSSHHVMSPGVAAASSALAVAGAVAAADALEDAVNARTGPARPCPAPGERSAEPRSSPPQSTTTPPHWPTTASTSTVRTSTV